jgi:hypothetical protein
MRSGRRLLALVVFLAAASVIPAGPAFAQASAGRQVDSTSIRAHVEALASPQFEGRLAGSAGERLAGEYIISELRKLGARPLPGQSEYRLAIEFAAGSRDGGSSITLGGAGAGRTFASRADVQALSFSDSADVTAPVVFAGYGIVVPPGQTFDYDSYAGLDVKDKVVVVLRYFPEDADQATRAILARYANLRYKAMAARQRGAKAMLVVTGPRSPNAGEIVPMSFDSALSGSGIAAASISGTVAQALFTASGRSLEGAQQSLDDGNPHVAGFALPDLTITLQTRIEREKQTAANVVAYLPATSTNGRAKPWVVLGAHYDHLGRGNNGNSLARKEETGQIHFGADDNASGTAAVLAVGAMLAKAPRQRHVMLAFWSGEEIGLLGSSAFVATPPMPIDQVAAYLNFDMVGRMQDNKLVVQGIGTSEAWPRIIEQANVAAGFDLQLVRDPVQPTDIASFNSAGLPCLNFFTGAHVDYHRPTDTADKVNYEDLLRVVEFAHAIAARVQNADQAPQFTKVEESLQPGGGRAGIRVFTGTIPDYTTETQGLLLGGVIGGGPAEQAGLQKDDVIVEIAGQTITNIYDYTYALELLKIGQPVKVVYLRKGERRETTLTPTARK